MWARPTQGVGDECRLSLRVCLAVVREATRKLSLQREIFLGQLRVLSEAVAERKLVGAYTTACPAT